jgi:hypothetical protein
MISIDMKTGLTLRKCVCVGDVARHLAHLCQGIVIGYVRLNREDHF